MVGVGDGRVAPGGGADVVAQDEHPAQQPGEEPPSAVHRDEILDCCWGLDYYPESRTLDQHIAKLRKRIEKDVSAPAIIETVRGVGYRYQPGG